MAKSHSEVCCLAATGVAAKSDLASTSTTCEARWPPTSHYCRPAAPHRTRLSWPLKMRASCPYQTSQSGVPKQCPLPATSVTRPSRYTEVPVQRDELFKAQICCWLFHQFADQHPHWPIRPYIGPGSCGRMDVMVPDDQLGPGPWMALGSGKRMAWWVGSHIQPV